MNSLKTVLTVIVLAVVAGAVYVLINNNDTPSTPPPDVADGWSNPPKVEMPGSPAAESPFDSRSGGVPPASSTGGLAPPFSPNQPSGSAPEGGMAPPFSPASGLNASSGQAPWPEGGAGVTPPSVPGTSSTSLYVLSCPSLSVSSILPVRPSGHTGPGSSVGRATD